MRSRLLAWAPPLLGVTLALAVSGGCDFLDPNPSVFLTVGFARTQPALEKSGVVVVVQQRGGAFLRIRTQGGAHHLSTTAAGPGAETSCLQLPSASDDETGLQFLTVVPRESEAMLFVDLLSPGKECSGDVWESRVLAVSRERALAPEPDPPAQGGSAGAGGKGGAGGASTTSGSATAGGGGSGGSGTTTNTETGGAGGGQ